MNTLNVHECLVGSLPLRKSQMMKFGARRAAMAACMNLFPIDPKGT